MVAIVDSTKTLHAKEGATASLDCQISPTPSVEVRHQWDYFTVNSYGHSPPPPLQNVQWVHINAGIDPIRSGVGGYTLLINANKCEFRLVIMNMSARQEGVYRCELRESDNPMASATRRVEIAREYQLHQFNSLAMQYVLHAIN